MSKVLVTDRDGEKHELEGTPGDSFMEILRDAGLPIEAICGGQSICSTCHVYVAEQWADKLPRRQEVEQVMVEDTGHFKETSRLSCQIEYSDSLDGIELTLAPQY
ncbi:MAG: 2Fe-2S iron-sulfur cluster-binding protein [Gammaproteobacteria bacterium]